MISCEGSMSKTAGRSIMSNMAVLNKMKTAK